jgi:hypothetical protein
MAPNTMTLYHKATSYGAADLGGSIHGLKTTWFHPMGLQAAWHLSMGLQATWLQPMGQQTRPHGSNLWGCKSRGSNPWAADQTSWLQSRGLQATWLQTMELQTRPHGTNLWSRKSHGSNQWSFIHSSNPWGCRRRGSRSPLETAWMFWRPHVSMKTTPTANMYRRGHSTPPY